MEAKSTNTETTDAQSSASDAVVRPDSNDAAAVAENALDESLWVRKWDDSTNQLYYFNLRTQESSWEEPTAYKAVLMSEPLDMNTERVVDAVEEPYEDPQQQNNATVAIQSLFRGRKDRKKVEEARKWTEQYDPATSHKYYYNSETGESQWEKPTDLLTGVRDERSDRAVKIQSLFRAKKARDRVKQLADEEEEEEELKQQLREEEEAVAAEEEKMAALTAEPTARAQWCEYFDPRSRKYYYRHAVSGAITWDKPEKFVSSSCVEGTERDRAALSIQCAARKRIAAKDVAAKREKLRALTDPVTMQRKLSELKQVTIEIEAEIEGRTLLSVDEEQQFPHLASLLSGWRESLESIKNHVISLENREDIQLADNLAARLVHAERFHKALADMRSECLALLRSILLMNSYFVDLDVSRINAGYATFAKWKSHELCALRDSRLLETIQGSDISQLLEHAEVLLQCSMGLTDFNNGSTSASGKRYEDWHPSVAAALVGVRELEEGLAKKTQLLRGYRAAEVRKRENYQMAEEDLLASRLAQIRQRRLNDKVDCAAFLAKCQEFWRKGLNQREDDLQVGTALASSKKHKQTKCMSPQGDPTISPDDENNANLSIWEATKEGAPVEIVRSMIFAEMQKANRRGNDFSVECARSDHGETLIQIACWWGHEHLVKFYLKEGAQIHDIDSTCNRFSLLHDAARRGHSRVIRILLQRGLSCKLRDSAGDTPLHWTARKNNYSAVLTLLGVYSSNRDKAQTDEIVKVVRQKNLRGKTAFTLAKNDRVRDVLKSAEEGRLPPLRRSRTGKPASVSSPLDLDEVVLL